MPFSPPTKPDSRQSLNWSSFATILLPSLVCYYVSAVLIIRSYPFLVRLLVLPVTLCMLYRCSVSLDLSRLNGSERNEWLNYWNEALLLGMTLFSMRAIVWTFIATPPRRIDSRKPSAAQLCFTGRYHEWNWSSGLHIPPEWRPTNSRTMFVLATLISMLIHIIVLDVLLFHLQSLSPNTFGSPKGGTIFTVIGIPDLRSTYISFFSGIAVYCAIQSMYDGCTIFGIILFQQNSNQWPPLFDHPWCSTSLNRFWAKGWHQVFRHEFIAVGAKPLYALGFGRVGAVLGAFTASGTLHVLGNWGLSHETEFWAVGGYFVIQGVGVVLEGVWKKMSGRKVGGALGWMWTVAWVVGWANFLIDAWARAGLIGSAFFPNGGRPVDAIGKLL
ncbi:uncharacterized protein EV420DRAFT_1257359 [Desarmillaria tabescens]|uniref:Wax synthase domain-containing protein n=1 Tax=Armillaria tabescens TaxID=1929756 RepID=A0AA39NP85_ARMTA|nr:uncharacterized protein EV420DRAFT_1257359 [Desarmillaria tabescens]KAK0469043.1 hypothetical protein EV420DRAFT_1257359 [Desarmillaria tabescens]